MGNSSMERVAINVVEARGIVDNINMDQIMDDLQADMETTMSPAAGHADGLEDGLGNDESKLLESIISPDESGKMEDHMEDSSSGVFKLNGGGNDKVGILQGLLQKARRDGGDENNEEQ